MQIEKKKLYEITNKLFNEDCFLGLRTLPDNSVDMVLTDPPYGVTDNAWDESVLFGLLWASLKRVCKPNAVVVVHCQQPFTNHLINTNPKAFKYCWYWDKGIKVGFLNAKKRPLKQIEELAVFWYGSQTGKTYNPQMTKGAVHSRQKGTITSTNYRCKQRLTPNKSELFYPVNLLRVPKAGVNFSKEETHPTEKPLELEEYMIKTYSNPGDLILDPFCGRATTCIAALNTGRKFCGFEQNEYYFNLGMKRIHDTNNAGAKAHNDYAEETDNAGAKACDEYAENAKNAEDAKEKAIKPVNRESDSTGKKNIKHNSEGSISLDELLEHLSQNLPF